MGGVDGSTAGYVALTAAALMEIMETASVGAAAGSLHTRTAMTVTDGVSEDGSVDAQWKAPPEDTAVWLMVSPGCSSGVRVFAL